MNALVEFTLPLSGLSNNIHSFEYKVRKAFFRHFENTPIEDGDIEVRLSLDKRPHLLVLDFEIAGTVHIECDRCLDKFDLPIENTEQLLIKYDEAEREEEEVIYISSETQKLNIAKFVYEFINLAVPIKKIHDDAAMSCNPEMMKYLNGKKHTEAAEGQISVWEALKKLSDKN